MPQVTLDVVSLDDKPLAGIGRLFEGDGGTIGRDEGNTLALPDAQKRVSRLHATISFPDDVLTITNSSKVLHVGVGTAQLAPGQSMPLMPGTSLSIGPYVLVVRPWEVAAPPLLAPVDSTVSLPARPAVGRAAVAPSPAGSDPFADLLSGLGPAPQGPGVATPEAPLGPKDDPLAALLGSAQASSDPNLAGDDPVAARDPFAMLGNGSGAGVEPRREFSAGPEPVRAPAPAVAIPEDFNPFDLPSATARNSADPLSSMLGGSAAPTGHALTQSEESIDVMFAPAGAATGDNFLGGASNAGPFGGVSGEPSSLLAQAEQCDPLALFGGSSRGDDSPARPMRDDLPEIGGAYQPPRALDPILSLAPAAQSPPPLPSSAARTDPRQPAALPAYAADALTRAFLTGANLPPSALPQGLTPEIMAMVGSLLRSATAGAIDMLAIRANIKREVQANVTIISSEANNPLKFMLDADSVLQHLLGKRMPGFMSPDEAMKDAFNDLRAHELGVIAGTRAALNEVLTKFDPALLGERLVRGSLLEMALPVMRKTKLWDLYLARYAQLRGEVEDDFQNIFGKAFVAAYEDESARMKAQVQAKGPR